MTKIKLCGLSRECDIRIANELQPEYIGVVFYKKSRRYVTPERAAELRRLLDPSIQTVGVFVNEEPEIVAGLLGNAVIDIAQLHGAEDVSYVKKLRKLTDKPFIQAFRIRTAEDISNAEKSPADFILLDSGAGGTGTAFDWKLAGQVGRPYFLAGGLDAGNVAEAVKNLAPWAVDVSSGIETEGLKDGEKMRLFVNAVRSV